MKNIVTMEVEYYRDAPYGDILALQRERFSRMVARRKEGKPVDNEWIMAVEHQPVYTLGRHGDRENLINRRFLDERGIELFDIERGGDITFHGPGQLVVYPLVDFGSRGLGVKEYVNLLEESVIKVCEGYGIEASRRDGAPGVWIEGSRKICAVGVKCSRFVAMHGLALNVTTDLGYFRAINPCGFTDGGVTSIAAETGTNPNWMDVAQRLIKILIELLAAGDDVSESDTRD